MSLTQASRPQLIAFAHSILTRDSAFQAPVRPDMAGRYWTTSEVGIACRAHDLPDAMAYARWDDWARAVRDRLRGERGVGGSVEQWVRGMGDGECPF